MLHVKKHTPLYIFLFAWLIINLIQSAFIGVDGDEAYYWMFSKNLAWGYFDHPPMVALLIKFGEFFGHAPFFTRLGTVLLTTVTAGIIFHGLPERLKQPKYYVLLFPSIIICNVYGFIATPDAPLFFFSALFFLGYKNYLEEDNFKAILLLSISITGMFYSKYHGILPLVFVLLSNIQLIKRKSFWLIVFIVCVLFLPHIYWQYIHDWPTIRFHLFERGLRIYKINFTLDYLLSQLLIWGPIISFFFYRYIMNIKSDDKFMKAHHFNFWGVLIIFLISSFKNHVEAHWTLVAGCSFIVLLMDIIDNGAEKRKKYFVRLATINIAFILILRMLLLVPGFPLDKINNYKPFVHGKSWADSVYKYAGSTPVIFTNSYILPALYNYYHPETTTIGYNTKLYRKTEYSINLTEDRLRGKNVFVFNDSASIKNPIIISKFKSGDLIPIDNYLPVGALQVSWKSIPKILHAGDTIDVDVSIKNTGNHAISNDGRLSLSYSFSKYSYIVEEGKDVYPLSPMIWEPSKEISIPIKIVLPITKGANRLLFSINNGILTGNFASQYYDIEINE